MRKMTRKPTSPGEMLSEEFLKPLQLTQRKFADHIGVEVKTINRIVNEHQTLTPELAAKFAAAFSMSVEFWLNLQMSLDIWNLAKRHPSLPKPLIKSRAS
ncbi:MAG: HigA family addiction module antitoxin [Pseudobdellovibrionaceae bacterium]